MTLESARTPSANFRQTLHWTLSLEHFAQTRYFVWFCIILASTITHAQTNPVPVINQPLVPAATSPGSPSFALRVNGTGFVPSSIVNWNGRPLATKFLSSSELNAIVPAAAITRAETASVTVVNPGPGGGNSSVDFFQVTTPSAAVTFKSSNRDSRENIPGVVAADLNADGRLDLVGVLSTGVLANRIGVWLGNGDGTFHPEATYPTATNPVSSPVIGDFNGDGTLDIAVACYGVVSVLLGNGDGTFQPHHDFPIDVFTTTGFVANGMATADFNADGKLDLVVGYQAVASNAVSVLLGNGDGTFQPPVDYSTENEPNAIGVADLNHDGKLDIVAGNFGVFGGNTVSVLLGNGDGTFRPKVDYTTANGPLSLVVADFNGDGNTDLAVVCPCGDVPTCSSIGVVSILLGNGDGTFRRRVDYTVNPPDGFPYTVTLGDYNGDGKLDLLVAILNTGQVALLLGNGDGTFNPGTLYGPTGVGVVGVATGDFNGDGALDSAIGTGAGVRTFIQTSTAFGLHRR
jgi:FG-GAP-like repeat